ncbi:MAG: glutathione S-transferase family protein [Rhodospirillaceae bacterium]|jgi:glutathione S-transferase|nr:glutathione S-transferase family protein [Rhodospirillaceae bacterium]MBT5666175.1 glutathione S-transferase family protein [Rhodospirillaceae bacterium]
MLKIIGRRTSGNVMKPLWAADEMGLEYEQVDLGGPFGGNDDPEYRAMNPMGLVPTIIDDGFVMWESNAITRYLSEKYGQGVLYPDDAQGRATADTWMDWQLTTVAKFMFPVFWGLVRTKPADRNMDQINAAIQEGIKFWAMLDNHLKDRDFIAGDRLTMGDIPVGPQAFRWFELVSDRPAMPHLEAWYQRLCDRPAFQKNCMNPLE